jgi:hypothetical protein
VSDKTRKKAEDALLLALACGATAESAARQCRVSERTVFRRLADPDFRRRLQELRADMVLRTSGALTAASTESVRTLLELQKPTHSGTVRLGAARAILEIGMRLREVVELEARLAALEAAISRPA